MKPRDLSDYSACIEMLFVPESGDYGERIQRAADAGFPAVEFWNATSKDLDALGRAVGRAGVKVASFVAEPGVALTDPANHDAFLAGLAPSRDRALKLGATTLIYVVGDATPGVPRARQHAAIVTAFRRAADVLAGSGVVIALEPINTGERPNTFLPLTPEALDIIDEVGRPEVKLLYDIYHSAVMGERMTEVLAGRVDRLAHVHLADHPGRHEPGTGGIAWRENLAWLRANGYRGRVGLEYRPAGGTLEGLRFLASGDMSGE